MATYANRLSVAALASVALWALAAGPAEAQFRIMNTNAGMINPLWRVGPGMVPLNQAAYNTAVFGNALSRIPPWAFGYNPYPQLQNFGPVYNPLLSGGYGAGLSSMGYGGYGAGLSSMGYGG